MAWKVDERIPKDLFVKLMIKKANIIKNHLKKSIDQLIIVANIGPTMAVFKLYDTKKEDSLKLHMTLSNLGDIKEQICQLWLQVNFLLQQYYSQCKSHHTNNNMLPEQWYISNHLIITKLISNANVLCYISHIGMWSLLYHDSV